MTWWKNQINKNERSVTIDVLDKGKLRRLIIPSICYPLNGELEIFNSQNTKVVTNKKILEVFDNINFEVGMCYSNTEKLCRELQRKGISAQPYVGWLFTEENDFPVHHCWCMVDDHLLDFADSFSLMYSKENVENFKKAKTINEARQVYASFFQWASTLKNSIRCHPVGQPNDFLLYIGSKCDPNDGRNIYNLLMQIFPNHEVEQNCDDEGYNPTLRLIKKNKINKRKKLLWKSKI